MAEGSFNHFGAIADALTPLLHNAVKNTAQEIIDDYRDTAAYDTGFMSESGYIVTSDESTYGQGATPTEADAYLLPEVDPPTDETTAIAAIGANYAGFVELGTRIPGTSTSFLSCCRQCCKHL